MLYFKNFNGAIRAKKYKKRSIIRNIPRGEEGVLIGIKYQDGEVFLGRKNIQANSKPITNLKYRNVSLNNLSEQINKLINLKIKSAVKAGLKVIFCIGETLKEKRNKKTNQVLARQISNGLKLVNNKSNIILKK